MSKDRVLIEQVITKYHPVFLQSADLRNAALANPSYFNVTHLIEESFAAVGPYTVTGGAYADFSDGSDSKTGSIRPTSNGGEIAGVSTSGGNLKTGDLRCIVYNPQNMSLLYYYLPKEFWQQHVNIHGSSNKGRLQFTYSPYYDSIPKFNGYRCNSFYDLAMK